MKDVFNFMKTSGFNAPSLGTRNLELERSEHTPVILSLCLQLRIKHFEK